MRFANKVAIVTGGGGEIGRATALRLAREGAAVMVVDRNSDAAEKVAAEIVVESINLWEKVSELFQLQTFLLKSTRQKLK